TSPTGDGGEQHVAPVGEVHVGDVREAEEDGGGDPADGVAIGGAGEKILQQAAEEKFFRPGSEEEDAKGEREEGFPFVPTRSEREEVEFDSERNGDTSEERECGKNIERPATAPCDGVAN